MERFELLATVTNDCLIDWDIVTDKVWRYEGPDGFLGHSREILRNYRKWWAENAHPEDKITTLADFYKAMDSGQEIWSYEYRFRGADALFHPVFEKGKFVRDSAGRVIRYLGALRDMSVQKESEEQLIISQKKAQTASLAKNRFIASMSHEFRTPLNAVIGFSQLLLEKGDDVDTLTGIQRDYIQRVYTAGKHMLALVSEISELSAIEQGKVRLSREKIYVADLLNDCVAIHDLRLKDQNLTLIRNKDKESVYIHADRKHMMQVFSNLLVNAIKYVPGGGKIEIDLRQDGDRTVFSVGDNGIGIAPCDQRRIFKDFEQLDDQRLKAGGAGLGLGLSICRKLVELHGGKIWVESDEGHGSRFYFSIPRSTDL